MLNILLMKCLLDIDGIYIYIWHDKWIWYDTNGSLGISDPSAIAGEIYGIWWEHDGKPGNMICPRGEINSSLLSWRDESFTWIVSLLVSRKSSWVATFWPFLMGSFNLTWLRNMFWWLQNVADRSEAVRHLVGKEQAVNLHTPSFGSPSQILATNEQVYEYGGNYTKGGHEYVIPWLYHMNIFIMNVLFS